MENASKALIIAGAVLIAILLIAFGVMMINSAREPIDIATGSGNEQAVQIFNSKFDSYTGTSVSGANVRTLMTAINTNNAKSSHIVKVKYGTGQAANTVASTTISGVVGTKTYKVEFVYDSTTGYITQANITQN